MPTTRPLRLALVDDYEVVLVGLAHMFEPYRDRVLVVEIDPSQPVRTDVDIALFDTFAQHEADRNDDVAVIVANGHARRVVVYSWTLNERLVEAALRQGASGYLSKTLRAEVLVDALERIHAGEVVISESPSRRRPDVGLDWPGRAAGLTERESEIIALVAQAKTNAQIAEICYLSVNTVKTYLRQAFRKLGVTSRTEAALWGLSHGFQVETPRMQSWRPATDAPVDGDVRVTTDDKVR